MDTLTPSRQAPCRRTPVMLAVALWLLAGSGVAEAMTVAELQALLRSGAPGEARRSVTLIDIRPLPHYRAGHIPNAIHLSAHALARKALPALGAVVVYGDGVDVATTEAAVEALAAREGISPARLEGGYPAWLAAGRVTTRRAGARRLPARVVSYEALRRLVARAPNLVIVDLRRKPTSTLSAHFPGVRVQRSADMSVAASRSDGRLRVLIDDGDGAAEKMARRLRGAGVRRVIVLAGGGIGLETRGRVGTGTRVSTAIHTVKGGSKR